MKFTATFEIEGVPEGHGWEKEFIKQLSLDIYNAMEKLEINIPKRFNREERMNKTIKMCNIPTIHHK